MSRGIKLIKKQQKNDYKKAVMKSFAGDIKKEKELNKKIHKIARESMDLFMPGL